MFNFLNISFDPKLFYKFNFSRIKTLQHELVARQNLALKKQKLKKNLKFLALKLKNSSLFGFYDSTPKQLRINTKLDSNFNRFIRSKKLKLEKSFSYVLKKSFIKTSAKRQTKLQNLSVFNKLWQKFVIKKTFKTYFPYLTNLRRKLELFAFNVKAKGLGLPLTESYLARFPASETSIINCLKVFWPGANVLFCKTLLSLGLCRINNTVVYNPLAHVVKYDCISFGIPSYVWLIISLLSYRSSLDQKKFRNFFFKSNRLALNSNFEVSYKLSEIIVIGLYNLHSSINKSYSNLKVNFQELLLQRFYSKQKKFGLGKNL